MLEVLSAVQCTVHICILLEYFRSSRARSASSSLRRRIRSERSGRAPPEAGAKSSSSVSAIVAAREARGGHVARSIETLRRVLDVLHAPVLGARDRGVVSTSAAAAVGSCSVVFKRQRSSASRSRRELSSSLSASFSLASATRSDSRSDEFVLFNELISASKTVAQFLHTVYLQHKY